MMILLFGALIASVYGGYTAIRHKAPLFYIILCLAMVSCLMGCVYTVLYQMLWMSEDNSFHVGYLGIAGMYFFLYSSYYGAIDSLADGGEPVHRKYRMTAFLVAAIYFMVSLFAIVTMQYGYWILILIVPMSGTLYFALKHLLIPDVEMGIIRVMRPYNALICVLCIVMTACFMTISHTMWHSVCSIGSSVLLIATMLVARNGVRKWFI